MFTIKHYSTNGYSTIHANGYRVEHEGGIVQVYYWQTDDEMQGPRNPLRTLSLCTSDCHVYVSNFAGKTVDHIMAAVNVPSKDGYVTAAK